MITFGKIQPLKGLTTCQELSNLLWSLGLQPSREEVESLLLEMDSDRFN